MRLPIAGCADPLLQSQSWYIISLRENLSIHNVLVFGDVTEEAHRRSEQTTALIPPTIIKRMSTSWEFLYRLNCERMQCSKIAVVSL